MRVDVLATDLDLFELSYPNEETARAALTRAIHKLPIKARIVTREEHF